MLTLAPVCRIGGHYRPLLVALQDRCCWSYAIHPHVRGTDRPFLVALTGPCGYGRPIVLTFLTVMFAPAAFAVAAHFTTSRRVLLLFDMPIAASISWSIVVVLYKRSSNG